MPQTRRNFDVQFDWPSQPCLPVLSRSSILTETSAVIRTVYFPDIPEISWTGRPLAMTANKRELGFCVQAIVLIRTRR